MLRKVMYSENSLTDQKPGLFHCWAGTMQDAYAVIEDTTTGSMHRCNDNQFRFVQPPVREHSSDKEQNYGNEILKELRDINYKLTQLLPL